MATHRYTGTCQCGRVRYEADIDFSANNGARRLPGDDSTVLINPSAFRLLSGANDLEDNQFGMLIGHNQACRYCGIRPFGKGRLKVLGGDFYAINLATIDREESARAL
jgi:hypothetical protein